MMDIEHCKHIAEWLRAMIADRQDTNITETDREKLDDAASYLEDYAREAERGDAIDAAAADPELNALASTQEQP